MTIRKRFATLAAAVALAFGLAACGTEPAEPATTAAAPAAAPMSDDELFLTVVREEIPNAGKAHIKLAHAVCDALDAGATMDQVALTMLAGAQDKLTPEQLGTIAGAGIGAYCPHHSTTGGAPA